MVRPRYGVFVLAAGLACLLVVPCLAAELDKGPYLQNVSSTGATVCWVTATGPADARQYQYHQARAEGLSPDREYEFVAGDTGQYTGTFRTFPAEPKPFTFVVYGDTRSNHDVHRACVRKIEELNPAFVINTGDLVSNGENMDDWNVFFDICGPMMATIPYFPVLGNHERNAAHYYDLFDLPNNERYYSFDYGDVHFVVLDSCELRVPSRDDPEYDRSLVPFYREMSRHYWQKQKAWLKQDLAAHNDASFVFVSFHHPLYSNANPGRRSEQGAKRRIFEEILRDARVTMVFNGHDHNYQRHFADGIYYVVSGGGGASLYDITKPLLPSTRAGAKKHHVIRVDVDGRTLEMTVITPEGEVIDTLKLTSR